MAMEEKYKNIINKEYIKDETNSHMSMSERAAQFSSFAALSGFDDEVVETSRYTDKRLIPDDEAIAEIASRLNSVSESIKSSPNILITYFEEDEKKEGGKYTTVFTRAVKIDMTKERLYLSNGAEIGFSDIYNIES